MTKPHLILVDGSGFIFRAYHAMPPLTNPEGTPVGAVYGFVNMMMKLCDAHECDHIAVIFDAARKTFRNRIYEDYKAHRPPPPDDLIPQFALVREATEALSLPAIDREDYEADDIIATYAKQAREAGMEVTIVSSDKDLMQLIGDGVVMFDAMKNKIITDKEVMEKFGVPPHKVLDVLSLIGDSSDNVPGVPSIGPKTAAELIVTYGSLDELLERTGEIKQPKRREAIQNNKEQALLSRELITLVENVPLDKTIADLKLIDRDDEKLATFLAKQGFKSLVAKLGKAVKEVAQEVVEQRVAEVSPAAPANNIATHYTTVRDEKELQSWIDAAMKAGQVAFDTETTSLDAMQAELVGFSLCVKPGNACYVPLGHMTEGAVPAKAQNDLFDAPASIPALAPGQMDRDKALAILKPLLADASVLKIGHNIKYDAVVLRKYNVDIFPLDDTMLMSYILSAGNHGQGMDELSERHFGMKLISYDDVTGKGVKRIGFSEVDIEKATQYAAEDADVTLRLHQCLKPKLIEQKLVTLYETIERPLVPVITRMEEAGVKIDKQTLAGMSSDFGKKIIGLEEEIKKLAAAEFNVSSPKQLGEILFDHMGIEGGKKSAKTGAYGTGADILEELAAQGHVIAEKVLEHRSLSKLKNTYCDTLPDQINPATGRVHTSYAMAIASTGRLSSSDPNLQNIPIRTEEGRKIRTAFVADTGNVLLSADYSQIELRLLAHMADIEVLKQAFKNGDDIHAITASKVFNVPMSEMTPEIRRRAKAINFGIIYGISAHGLSVQLGIGRGEAAEIIKSYFATYPGIHDYMETCKEFARTHGYVETLYKRRCHLPGINDKNAARRQFSERAAINAPLQGTAADIIKRAMIAVDKHIEAPANMLLQVHDELIFEMPEHAVEHWQPRIKQRMEGAASLSVPLVVETGIGKHWGEAH